MKIVIIGSGGQGTGLAGLLALEKNVEKLVICDYSEKALEAARKQLLAVGDKLRCGEVTYQTVNAADIQDVARVIHGNDICFHAILPKFNIPIMKACLQEKVHYLDLIALPYAEEGISKDETIGAQLELDHQFREANLVAIPSVGISPGWTLFAAGEMIKEMDEVRRVVIRWSDYIDTDQYTCSINPTFVFTEWLGAPYPSAWKNGTVVAEDLIGSEEEFEFPAPIGKRKVYTCTSQPDIVMIPTLSPKPIPYCVEKGGVNLGKLDPLHVIIKGIQQATAKQGYDYNEINMIEEFGKTMIPPTEQAEMLANGTIRDRAICFSVEVDGARNGEFVSHIQYNTCTQAAAERYLPWIAPAVYDTVGGLPIILIEMIASGELKQRGVFSVSQLNLGKEINDALKVRGHMITEKITRG